MPKSKKPKRTVKPLSEVEKQLLQQCEANIQHACETDPEVLVFLSIGDRVNLPIIGAIKLCDIAKLTPADVAKMRELVASNKAEGRHAWDLIAFTTLPGWAELFLIEKHNELMKRWPKVDQWKLAEALVDTIAA